MRKLRKGSKIEIKTVQFETFYQAEFYKSISQLLGRSGVVIKKLDSDLYKVKLEGFHNPSSVDGTIVINKNWFKL
jgi:hypothetical protein